MIDLFVITDVLVGVLEVFVVLKIFEMIAVSKNLQSKKLIISCAILIFIRAFEMIFTDHNSNNQLGLLCIVLIFAMLKQPILRRIYNCIFVYLTYLLATVVVQFMITTQSNFFDYLQGAIIAKLLLLIFMLIFIQSSKANSSIAIPKYLYIPLITFQLSTFLIIFMLENFKSENYQTQMINITFVAAIVLSISNVLMFYLLEYYLKQAREKDEILISKTIDEYKVSYYRELAQKQKTSNKAIHDLKNQLFAIRSTLESDSETASVQIEEICKNVLGTNFLSLTKIDAVDALIASKCQLMQNQNIRFKPVVFLENQVKISDMELCVLLGNLLDNAIEANVKIQDSSRRYIDLSIKQQNDYLSINISNPVCTDNVLQINEQFQTSKKEKQLHGFGIKSIEEIAEKFDGNCIFKSENGVFSATIMLLNK